jgi:hypothetical protein
MQQRHSERVIGVAAACGSPNQLGRQGSGRFQGFAELGSIGIRIGRIVSRATCAVTIALAVGCWQPPKMQRAELDRGYILMLEGIDFNVWQMGDIYRGLRDAGIDCAIDVVEWGYRSVPLGGYLNLTDIENNRRLAGEFAWKIAGYQKEFPDRPVRIIGYSGGGGLAVLTAEVLPDGAILDRILLFGAAISPDYDLSKALSRCRRGIVNFYSSADCLVLGTGTQLYGTIDRAKTSSAGHVGFRTSSQPATSQASDSSKLIQVAWTPEMRKLGHDGGHFGWMARRWTAQIVAPYVRNDE